MTTTELFPTLLGSKKALVTDETNDKLLRRFLALMTLCLTIAYSARNDKVKVAEPFLRLSLVDTLVRCRSLYRNETYTSLVVRY